MKNINLYSLFLVLLFSCNKQKRKTNYTIAIDSIIKCIDCNTFLQIDYIKTKYILENDTDLIVSTNRYYHLSNKKYPVEEITKYDASGNAVEYLKGKSEGFVVYKKKNTQGETLPFGKEQSLFRISIDKIHSYLIDNGDTIKKFSINKEGRRIRTSVDVNNRFRLYEY